MKHTRGAFSALLLLSLCVSVGLGACNGEGEGETDGDAGDCPSDEVFFEEKVWQPIASMSCYGCHNAEGTAKATRMILQGPDEDGAVEYNMELMATMAMEQVDGVSLILAKPTGTHPDGHGGGVVVKADSADYEALAEFAARVDGTFVCEDAIGDAPTCEEIGAGPRAVRRLSHVEYDNTVADLFGVSGELASQAAGFAPESVPRSLGGPPIIRSAPLVASSAVLRVLAIRSEVRLRAPDHAALRDTLGAERAAALGAMTSVARSSDPAEVSRHRGTPAGTRRRARRPLAERVLSLASALGVEAVVRGGRERVCVAAEPRTMTP